MPAVFGEPAGQHGALLSPYSFAGNQESHRHLLEHLGRPEQRYLPHEQQFQCHSQAPRPTAGERQRVSSQVKLFFCMVTAISMAV